MGGIEPEHRSIGRGELVDVLGRAQVLDAVGQGCSVEPRIANGN